MDRYYTPQSLATELLSECRLSHEIGRVVDPSCGMGALLHAAERVLNSPKCIGIDVDRSAIESLRAANPHWELSVANILNSKRVNQTRAGKAAACSEMVLLNPPFSQEGRKFFTHRLSDRSEIRVSRAMKFLLQSISIFANANLFFAIVPESLLFSELDSRARKFIDLNFTTRVIGILKSTSFRGARVNTAAVELQRGSRCMDLQTQKIKHFTKIVLERGSMPLHLAEQVDGGVPLLHTTDIASLTEGFLPCFQTLGGAQGNLGWAIFLPRVGLPKRTSIKPTFVSCPLRLSDCVLGIWFSDSESASKTAALMLEQWDSFLNNYRGSCARYTTVSRIADWLSLNGIESVNKRLSKFSY